MIKRLFHLCRHKVVGKVSLPAAYRNTVNKSELQQRACARPLSLSLNSVPKSRGNSKSLRKRERVKVQCPTKVCSSVSAAIKSFPVSSCCCLQSCEPKLILWTPVSCSSRCVLRCVQSVRHVPLYIGIHAGAVWRPDWPARLGPRPAKRDA